jgi:SAM-dependent methyltransferase
MLLRAAGQYYQRAFDLSPAQQGIDPDLQKIAAHYDWPYRLQGRPRRVAIVGAGTGNDVAAALRAGAERVDAVEIDPAILDLGVAYHPERPYQDPRVRRVVNDARTFFRRSTDTYDLIVYGLLDSHTLLSQASSVRLDSFVYTVEGLREARARLAEDGILSLSFSILNRGLGKKILLMMEKAFDGHPPVVVRSGYDGSITFAQAKNGGLVVPRALIEETGFEEPRFANPDLRADVSTDDWPFFYMAERVYPTSYVVMVVLVLVLSLGLTASFLDQKPAFSHASFFFLGAGFMLVETKAITEMGLVFGNTWHVIGIVIAGILLMAFLANVVVERLALSRPFVPFVLLLASLGGGLLLARAGGLPSTTLGQIGTVVVLTGPMFFSGMVFSTLIRSVPDISAVMAANLMGTMLGGLLEYNSMYFGFRFLYWLALACYAAAFLATLKRATALR